MTKFFHIHATLEVHRALDDLRIDVDELTETFPNCLHLKSYLALIEYHLRGAHPHLSGTLTSCTPGLILL